MDCRLTLSVAGVWTHEAIPQRAPAPWCSRAIRVACCAGPLADMNDRQPRRHALHDADGRNAVERSRPCRVYLVTEV